MLKSDPENSTLKIYNCSKYIFEPSYIGFDSAECNLNKYIFEPFYIGFDSAECKLNKRPSLESATIDSGKTTFCIAQQYTVWSCSQSIDKGALFNCTI
jgi:hypothetical protein